MAKLVKICMNEDPAKRPSFDQVSNQSMLFNVLIISHYVGHSNLGEDAKMTVENGGPKIESFKQSMKRALKERVPQDCFFVTTIISL